MTNSWVVTTLMTMVAIGGFATLVWWLSSGLAQNPPANSSK
jgi:hypothetical protein